MRAWPEAYEALSAASRSDVLTAADHDRLAVSAFLVGRDDECLEALERGHRLWLEHGDVDRAALGAFWMGMLLLLRNEAAPANGWLGRGRRLVAGVDCPAAGYLGVSTGFLAFESGDVEAAERSYAEVLEIGERFGDLDLVAFGLLGRGEVAIVQGRAQEGLALLDEAMVLARGEVASPLVVGILYCAVIAACLAVFDLRRASEWTDALGQWCDDQPGMVPYRGQCLVHRSQVQQANGLWVEALAEAAHAHELLVRSRHPAAGLALYQRGEVHRLRGELDEADDAYRQASRAGHEPVPGLALARLATGQVAAAVAMVERMLDEASDPPARLAVLPALVEIELAAGDVAAARRAVDELDRLAASTGTTYVDATAAHARGAVALAGGEPAPALRDLRRACQAWSELAMPYERARSQELVGLACRALGDHDACEVEREAARAEYERLGAIVDLRRLADGAPVGGPASPTTPLTGRECEVLRLVARGRTNREIGAELVISEHTVARHVQNVFAKIDVSSRAAATAYAYEHDLI